MNLTVTLIVLAIVGAVFALASWRGMQPADPLKPRLLPWRAIIVASGALAVFLLVHLLTMLGLKADRPAPY